MVRDGGDSAGVLCCRSDRSKNTRVRPMDLQSPLLHHGLASSPQFFLLPGIVALCPLKP